ncbi:MAG: aspartate carbamoyltransferase regulatory subunit [Sulfolobaceae archaeon]|nr:aspartate carbamoyltransferase regulatory subunit [Sulfolobaceae archaeon]
MKEKTLIVNRIREGTVIDHIPAGRALAVLHVLGIKGNEGYSVALVMNVESRKLGKKDIVKIEGKFLDERETSLITLIAPTATVNIIKDYEVVEKRKLKLPDEIRGLLTCPNTSCISRNDVEAVSKFRIVKTSPLLLKCEYCETYITEEEVMRQILHEIR